MPHPLRGSNRCVTMSKMGQNVVEEKFTRNLLIVVLWRFDVAIRNQLDGISADQNGIFCDHSQTHLVLRVCPSYLQSLAGSVIA